MNDILTNFGLWFLSTVIVAILVNVFSGIITEPIKRWLDNKPLVSRRKSISKLQNDIYLLELDIATPNKVYLKFIGQIAFTLIVSAISILSFLWGNKIGEIGFTFLPPLQLGYARDGFYYVPVLAFYAVIITCLRIEKRVQTLINFDRLKIDTLEIRHK